MAGDHHEECKRKDKDMHEYYELTLTHKVTDDECRSRNIGKPIILRAFVSPLMMDRSNYPDAEREALIDELFQKMKDYLKNTGAING